MTEIFRKNVPECIDDAMMREILALLPSWRLEKALSYRRPVDRWLCAQAYLMLDGALLQVFGFGCRDGFSYGPGGKPYLRNHPDAHFNISHCEGCVCCAVSDRPVGVDVEMLQYDPDLARTVCNNAELRTIATSQRPEIEFTKLWTMKESCLKLCGEGLRNDLRDILSSPPMPVRFTFEAFPTYMLCLAEPQ